MLGKTKMAGLVMAMMALSAPLVWADNGNGDKGAMHHQEGDWHHGDHDQMLAKILNLTDDQVKQLKDAKQKQKEAMKAVFEQMKANRQAFDAEIVKAATDMPKITDLQAQLKTIQSQMVDNHLNAILEIKKILTPEQFAGYRALEKAKKMMMHKGPHQFGHKGDFGKEGQGHEHWADKDNDGDR